jgi:hypothetical protein
MRSGRMSERGALRLIRVAGGIVLVLFLVFQVVNPRAPVVANTPGFHDPVAGFELASTPEHVLGILGPPGAPARADTVRRMKLGLYLDYAFLLAYPAFYAGIAWLLLARGSMPPAVATIVVVLAIAMAIGDALEDRELLRLADTIDAAAMGPALARLRMFTLLKWHAIFGASVVVGVTVGRLAGWWRWSAPFFVLAGLVGFFSLVRLPAIEWSLAPLGLAWTIAWLAAFRTRPAATGSFYPPRRESA